MHKDLESVGESDVPAACAALTALTKLVDPGLSGVAAPLALTLLEQHPASQVRVKALGVLMRCWEVAPRAVESLVSEPLPKRIGALLADSSSAVVSSAAAWLRAMLPRQPAAVRVCLPQLLKALGAVLGTGCAARARRGAARRAPRHRG